MGHMIMFEKDQNSSSPVVLTFIAKKEAAKDCIEDFLKSKKSKKSLLYGATFFFMKGSDKLSAFVDNLVLYEWSSTINSLIPRTDNMFGPIGWSRMFSEVEVKT